MGFQEGQFYFIICTALHKAIDKCALDWIDMITFVTLKKNKGHNLLKSVFPPNNFKIFLILY